MPKRSREPDVLTRVAQRYRGLTAETLVDVLSPMLLEVVSVDRRIGRDPGGPWRAGFEIAFGERDRPWMVPGRTGKFVPHRHVAGGEWIELAKGRILQVDHSRLLATGEIYTGGTRAELVERVEALQPKDWLEIDRFGASAKLLSALVEAYFLKHAQAEGFTVARMPEDIARHVGEYAHYDFLIAKGNRAARVEIKSLWGTNTKYARLIRTKTKTNPTSSPPFTAQDVFAVNLFLRTGRLTDFAFAQSVSMEKSKRWGLPYAPLHPTHLHQNPEVPDPPVAPWSVSLNDVFKRAGRPLTQFAGLLP